MDIGGFSVESSFQKENVTEEWKELNLRWHQFGTFVPLFRSHGQKPYREIYNIDPSEGETYNALKFCNELRYKLMPYIYSLAAKVHYDDYTIMRLLAFEFPEKEVWDIDDQFMFGPALMISPVYIYKARSRSIYFPAGGWYDFYTGAYLSQPGNQTVDAPYNKMPLYAKVGTIIPTGEVIQSTADIQINLRILVYTGADATFDLYEDDGTTYSYEKGEFSTIRLTYNESQQSFSIGDRNGTFSGMPQERNLEIVFISSTSPSLFTKYYL